MRSLLMVLAVWAIAASLSSPSDAQPTPEQLTVRPGDKIIWTDTTMGHVVIFGGLPALKPLADVQKVLTFDPPLSVDGPAGVSPQGGNPMLTATVKADALASGVTGFNFGCAVHPGSMISRAFTIAPSNGQPPREHKIRARSNPNNWELETAAGGVVIDAMLASPPNSVAANQPAGHRH